MKENRGFVLMEAIVVITVLSVILITLYGAYSKILTDVKKQSLYDNTEYIYKTSLVRNILESSIEESAYTNVQNYIYCSDNTTACSSKDERLEFMKVKSVYITPWNIDVSDARELEATTQKYIKSIDAVYRQDKYRIIVMFEQENDQSIDHHIYEYASLMFGSRD